MRITVGRSLLFASAVVAASVLAPPSSNAQTFPTSTWVPLTRSTAAITAASNATGNEDIIGDASYPPAYVQSDASYLYLRIRIDGDPKDSGSNKLRNRNYGCEIDTNGVDATYEYLASYDGILLNGPYVTLRQNSGTTSDSPGDYSETEVNKVLPGGYPSGTYAVVSAATDSPSTTDYFVDLAIPRSWFPSNNGPDSKSLRFVCGVGSTTGLLDLDAFGSGTKLSEKWSDGYTCTSAGCSRDRDLDRVPDTVENGFGTNPLSKDSDGDGIPDNIELTATGNGVAPFAGVNTDGDGLIDALDTDSDNDCRTDQNEGTLNDAWRTADANPSSVCTVATAPVCSAASGTCVACGGDNGGGNPAQCPSSSLPACQSDGRCTQCKPGLTTKCTTAAPACNASGSCVACTGDNGDTGATAACPSASAPACQIGGALSGRCTTCSATNVTQCTNASAPACDTATGSCAACNGDRGGGSSRPCPTTASPRCDLGAGTCGKCTTNADCGTGHTGPTCDVGTGACIDTDSDGDGLNDSVELLLGTNPSSKDSDGDGIQDDVEVTPTGGGASAKIDTDNDGTIDALDTDSDNDGVPDAQEGIGDTDGDGAPDFRDGDDDGDTIPTAIEVQDAKNGKVGDDVDGDGKKNWLDTDANGNGTLDDAEGRGDQDGDGILDYLDLVKDTVKPDAGTASSSSSGGGSTSSSGFTSTPDVPDAAPPPSAPPEIGVIEGTGLFCGRALGDSSANVCIFVLGALAVVRATRRARRR